jgi:hypothetical protein
MNQTAIAADVRHAWVGAAERAFASGLEVDRRVEPYTNETILTAAIVMGSIKAHGS